ncbi:MAG: hypothetical protein JXA07_11645 [Spirochaetes bacterium]|nr:hypothetical protein [Spirochaetota bacterium]
MQNVYVQSRAKEITAFSINGVDGVIAYPFITVTLPAGADVTDLVAAFTTSGTSVTVDDIEQESGVIANNFTDPVVYRVTAEDGSTQEYTVSVSVTSAACIDLDDDGYGENCSLGFDCNDYDPNIHPGAQEICDGLDNDCDGVFDADSSSNYLTQSCYDGDPQTIDVGECRAGIQTCLDGYWGACAGQVLPSEEVCDGEDNDCDADYDENLTRACYTGPFETRNEGLCQDGTQTCFAGEWGACEGEVLPSEEICGDFLDNDCNAEIDEICM